MLPVLLLAACAHIPAAPEPRETGLRAELPPGPLPGLPGKGGAKRSLEDGLPRAQGRKTGASLRPDSEPVAVTADGWTLPLRHYGGEGTPVLLVHGMGVSHYNWDWREDVSLAAWLRARGWDVWVASLRGDPGTTAPDVRTGRSWSFEEHARLDLPAIVDAVLAETGEPRLAWVGHSMGGMLLYTALGLYPDKISAGVAICSPASFAEITKLYKTGRAFRFATGGKGRAPVRAVVPWVRAFGARAPLANVLSNPDNMDPAVARGLISDAVMPVPWEVAREMLGWLDAGELVDRAGARWVTPADVPVLALGGAADRLVPWKNVAAACDVYADCTFRLLGTEGGFSVDYGHVDPVVGKTAEAEIYPVIEGFLRERAR